MSSHTVLVGYGVRGRVVVAALQEGGHTAALTVIDSDPERVEQAGLDGAHAVVGPGWRLSVLWSAGVRTADHVVVAVSDDAMALRITSVVRSLNETATVITLVRSADLHELIEYLGADHVVNSHQAAEWALDAQHLPGDGVDFPDLEWAVAERAVSQEEIGCSPLACGHQVLAVMRDGRRIWAEDPAVAVLRGDDRLLVLSSIPGYA